MTILDPIAVEPNNAVAAAADERLKHAYQQIASADEQLVRVTEQLSKLERDAAQRALAPPGRPPSAGRSTLRGVTGLLLAACIVGAAFVSQSSWGEATRLVIARWVPQAALASSASIERPELQASPGAVQLAAAGPTAVPASSPAQAAPQDVALTVAPLSPELAQQLQTITQDIANLDQKLEQLKAAQVQIASDNAKAIEELKAGQEQMTRLVTKSSEPSAQPRGLPVSSSSAPIPSRRPIPIAPRQPTSAHASPQARSSPGALPPQDQ
ncbi:hypothetical protein [Bradyrhizobium sp. Tv2a-2]|uniref:hypothetical protein n=1 Tax=Bradyrhizobium sp. Tv2a-2 TaxID=113395 RepID=UPI0004188DCE|nr:hypothetical protein [Bradyrhizobium sp. Tv2a-2]